MSDIYIHDDEPIGRGYQEQSPPHELEVVLEGTGVVNNDGSELMPVGIGLKDIHLVGRKK